MGQLVGYHAPLQSRRFNPVIPPDTPGASSRSTPAPFRSRHASIFRRSFALPAALATPRRRRAAAGGASARLGMRIARRWAPSVLWGMGILAVTSLPGSALPAGPALPGTDKLVHVALYAVLAALVAHAAPGHSVRTVLMVGGALAAFAAVDEWHQQWIPGRSADALDWLADMAGVVAGYTFSTRTARQRRETRT